MATIPLAIKSRNVGVRPADGCRSRSESLPDRRITARDAFRRRHHGIQAGHALRFDVTHLRRHRDRPRDLFAGNDDSELPDGPPSAGDGGKLYAVNFITLGGIGL